MPQFLIQPSQIEGDRATLTGEESKHLVKVLRHKVGDSVFLSDGAHQYEAVIETIHPKAVDLRLVERRVLKVSAPSPALAIALLKHDHLELVLQKGVELGIAEFFLFVSERTIPHYGDSVTPKKMARFEKIIKEAAKQTGMVTIPKIHPLLTFEQLIHKFKDFSGVLLAWEKEEDNSFHSLFQTIDSSRLLVVIGPEGGFPLKEVTEAEKAGAKGLSLGRQILRAETAAIATLTLCQYELGNI
ncbi:MAG: RsmE family RNA methyltransferase [Deltaproteobacteria bacterium]|nr:RsmE family RNA methyltransferase [Deltaproteobacteria bacterium]